MNHIKLLLNDIENIKINNKQQLSFMSNVSKEIGFFCKFVFFVNLFLLSISCFAFLLNHQLFYMWESVINVVMLIWSLVQLLTTFNFKYKNTKNKLEQLTSDIVSIENKLNDEVALFQITNESNVTSEKYLMLSKELNDIKLNANERLNFDVNVFYFNYVFLLLSSITMSIFLILGSVFYHLDLFYLILSYFICINIFWVSIWKISRNLFKN